MNVLKNHLSTLPFHHNDGMKKKDMMPGKRETEREKQKERK